MSFAHSLGRIAVNRSTVTSSSDVQLNSSNRVAVRSASISQSQQRSNSRCIRAQALSSRDADDVESPAIQRGSMAGPLRVLSPLREASSALANTLQEIATSSGLIQDSSKVSMREIQQPISQDMEICRKNLVDVVGKRHPLLRAAADQIFSAGGKRIRPLIVLLVARATLPMHGLTELTERHRRLAEITEMIHTASLVHDDVLDDCDIRRGKATVNSSYGNRVAVLVGDFLFAQSSWFLANLDNLEVIKLISQVIADFADGEISQAASLFDTSLTLGQYLDKSFWKTASLIAASCRGAAVFSECDDSEKLAMYEYGRHLGLAFQVVDDILDFTQSTEKLGKPQGQDLASGNLTAPVLFALEHPTVGPKLKKLISSKFKDQGSLVAALALVEQGSGIERARLLARAEADQALANLAILPESPSKEALTKMVDYVLERLY